MNKANYALTLTRKQKHYNMKKLLLSLITMAVATSAWALDVECSAGKLASLIDDYSVTTLKVTGTMDARDFKFIATKLNDLTTLDLSKVRIVAYSSSQPLFGEEFSHNANTIPEMAFFDTGITSIVLPAQLKAIGKAAFASCEQLTTIELPATVESIDYYAFSASGLTQVVMPEGLTSLGEGAFARCEALTSATISPSTSMTIGKDAFYDCKALADVQLGPAINGIGDGAFAGCTSLTSITFTSENNLLTIGKAAFAGAGITNYDFEASNLLNSIDDWAFAGSKQVSATMPLSTTHVGTGAFYYAPDLNSYTPSKQLDSIANYLLAGTAITNDNAPGIKTIMIGDYAFYNTPATSFTIPSTVKEIGTQAMAGMTQLQSLTSEATVVPMLGDDVWAGVNQAVIPLTVPRESYAAYCEALQWKNFMIKDPTVYGDVNCDGVVNAADVTALYNYILNNIMTYYDTSDVNGDGVVNAGDVTCVYNVILGYSTAPHAPNYIHSSDAITASAFNIEAGATHPLDIEFNNSTAYTAMQLDINMPQGLSISAVRKSQRTSDMNIQFAKVEEGKWRILASTSGNATWSGNEGTLFTIIVKADDTWSGNDAISLNSIIAVEPCEDIHMIDDINVEVSNTTGVKDINIDNNGPVDVYNMNGQLLRKQVDRNNATTGLPAGFYIVGGKKVLVK